MPDFQIANPMFIAAPACCFICGGAPQNNGGFLIDLRRRHHMLGNMYLCDSCREGVATVDDAFVRVEAVEKRIAEAEAVRIRAQETLLHLRETLDNLPKEAT